MMAGVSTCVGWKQPTTYLVQGILSENLKRKTRLFHF